LKVVRWEYARACPIVQDPTQKTLACSWTYVGKFEGTVLASVAMRERKLERE
jgi:hypothetical protein